MKQFMKRLLVTILLSISTTIAVGQDNSKSKQIRPITIQSQGLIVIVPKSRDKLMAYSYLTSTWNQSDISVDASVKINPTVGRSMAACQLDQEVHAYSAKSAVWAKLKLPQDSETNFTVGDNFVMVYVKEVKEKEISKLYIFGENSKTWSGVDLNTGEMLLDTQQKK